MLQGPSGPQTMFLLPTLTVCTPKAQWGVARPEVSLPVCTALYTVCNALARLLSLSGIEAPGGSQAGAVPPLCPGEEAESRGKWPIHGRAGAQPPPLLPVGALSSSPIPASLPLGAQSTAPNTRSTFPRFLSLLLLLGPITIFFVCTMRSLSLSFQSAFSSVGFDEPCGVRMVVPIWQMR